MRSLMIGLFAVGVLMCVGLVSFPAKAVPSIPELKQKSLVEEAGYRVRTVRRP